MNIFSSLLINTIINIIFFVISSPLAKSWRSEKLDGGLTPAEAAIPKKKEGRDGGLGAAGTTGKGKQPVLIGREKA